MVDPFLNWPTKSIKLNGQQLIHKGAEIPNQEKLGDKGWSKLQRLSLSVKFMQAACTLIILQ